MIISSTSYFIAIRKCRSVTGFLWIQPDVQNVVWVSCKKCRLLTSKTFVIMSDCQISGLISVCCFDVTSIVKE